jgi:divalent metal cation (Fe/Co/Zn/Cd) transporter
VSVARTDKPIVVDRPVLVRRALLLAMLTIAWNVVEGVFAMGFGFAEESLALFGFGVDSFVEVGAAVMVLWRLRGESGLGTALARDREKTATMVIGGLLLALGVGVAVGSVIELATGGHPDSTVPGVIVSGLSIALMLFLWRAKRSVALALDSRTLLADAACSRSCLQLSVILLAGSLLYAVFPALWWADSAAAIALAVLIGREGWESIQAARKPDFTGGCCGGCSVD